MTDRDEIGLTARPVIYCVVPRHLVASLHDPLRRHFRADPTVVVVAERRQADRRARSDRRSGEERPHGPDRRFIRALTGRRAGERRATPVPVPALELPRKARRLAAELEFIERLEPSDQQLEDADTARLVARIQSGEVARFADLYLRYFDRVYGYLRVVLRDSHEADEAAQEVFTRVLGALPSYERRDRPFRSWLFVIVRNCALDRVRELRRTELGAADELCGNGDQGSEDTSSPGALGWISDPEILMLVERLPLAQRQVLVLRFLLDLPSREIAELLQRSPEDVRILQHRALHFLRERLRALDRGAEHGQRGGIRMRVYRKQLRVLRTRRFALR